ncbi:MAG: AAA family ATPase, partial [Clostridia bacterium]|nr:AAA family ATPase [Clostridia bacterium]
MQIKATVSRIRWRADSGWAVVDCTDEAGARFVAVGSMPTAYEGARLELSGEWTVHKTYGKQFSVQSYAEIESDSIDNIFKYLSSGIIKGVGIPMAKAITGMFGAQSLEIIENEPSKLELISGIGKKKSKMIHDSFMEKRGMQELYMGMQRLGFTMNQTAKIHKLYGDNCVRIIEQNPYRLISDVESIGFKTADRIAHNAGFDHDSPFRIKAGVRHALNEARLEGHTCLEKEELVRRTAEDILGVDVIPVENAIEELVLSGDLIEKPIGGEDMVFLSGLHYCEMHSAVCLMELANSANILPLFDIEGQIGVLEQKFGAELAPKQRQAVTSAFSEGVLVVTGGPGTGKTTILRFMIELMEQMELKYELA